ncbi:hypothetical protein AB6A40_010794 [Gnathostoma spinigerum]|uniref:Uncharacterized protein n=1 Tax=Gnathostoma spinigerum TaxID=75299 RepID=A0ABD6EXA2_9BILA
MFSEFCTSESYASPLLLPPNDEQLVVLWFAATEVLLMWNHRRSHLLVFEIQFLLPPNLPVPAHPHLYSRNRSLRLYRPPSTHQPYSVEFCTPYLYTLVDPPRKYLKYLKRQKRKLLHKNVKCPLYYSQASSPQKYPLPGPYVGLLHLPHLIRSPCSPYHVLYANRYSHHLHHLSPKPRPSVLINPLQQVRKNVVAKAV